VGRRETAAKQFNIPLIDIRGSEPPVKLGAKLTDFIYPNKEKRASKNLRILEISKKFRPYLTKTYEQTIRNFYRIFVKNAQVFR
jgi:hypothetical protein